MIFWNSEESFGKPQRGETFLSSLPSVQSRSHPALPWSARSILGAIINRPGAVRHPASGVPPHPRLVTLPLPAPVDLPLSRRRRRRRRRRVGRKRMQWGWREGRVEGEGGVYSSHGLSDPSPLSSEQRRQSTGMRLFWLHIQPRRRHTALPLAHYLSKSSAPYSQSKVFETYFETYSKLLHCMHCIFIFNLNLDMYVIIYVNCQMYHYESVASRA